MDLYFAPLACSLATHIALCEAGANARVCSSGQVSSAPSYARPCSHI